MGKPGDNNSCEHLVGLSREAHLGHVRDEIKEELVLLELPM